MLYQDFVLLLQPISRNPRAIYFRSTEPIDWCVARDRIIATGETAGFTIGGFGEGRFMISVASDDIERHQRAGIAPRPL